jgi:hypothetical protein
MTAYSIQFAATWLPALEPHPEDAKHSPDRRPAIKYQTRVRLPELDE